jgi:hypothetical protein
MAAEPPMGQLDPEDQDSDDDDLEIGLMGETPKHFAVQVMYWPSRHCHPILRETDTLRGGSIFMASEISIYCGGKGIAKQWFRPRQTRTIHVMDRRQRRGIQGGDRAR